jgi:hypothetical protein
MALLLRVGSRALRLRHRAYSAAAAAHLDLVCSGCGERVPAATQAFFRCPNADAHPDVDHVLEPQALASAPAIGTEDLGSSNPFVRYRALLYSHRVALARGMDDSQYVAMANGLNEALQVTGGVSFAETPLLWHEALNCFFKVEVRATLSPWCCCCG